MRHLRLLRDRFSPSSASSEARAVLMAAALAAFAVAGETPAATASSRGDGGRSPAEITGTVQLNGCEIDPARLTMEAAPVEIDSGSLAGGRGRPPAWGLVKTARFWATDDPHVAGFVIHGAGHAGLYQLRIGYSAEECGKVFWRGPFEGFVVPGQDPVAIEGFAARTTIEVFDPHAGIWAGAADLFDDTGLPAIRQFRWRSSDPEVVGGELQIASRAFPLDGDFDPCGEPEDGFLFRAEVASEGAEWAETEIDLTSVLGAIIIDIDEIPAIAAAAATAAAELPAVPDRATLKKIALGAPLYARVVPATADGPLCEIESDGVHGWALVTKLADRGDLEVPQEPPAPRTLEAGDQHLYAPPWIAGGELQGHPTVNEPAYWIVKDHQLPPTCNGWGGLFYRQQDPLGCALVDIGVKAGSTVSKGSWFFYEYHPSGGGSSGLLGAFTDSLTGLVTGAINLGTVLANSAAQLWEDIQKAVKAVALDVIEKIPGPLSALCDQHPGTCEGILDTAMTTGLAAMGLPPSLPDFDQLKAQGLDYLASQIQSEVLPVENVPGLKDLADELRDQAVDLALETLDQMAARRGGSDPRYDWVVPYLGFHPAYAEIAVRRNGAAPLPEDLVLTGPSSFLYLGFTLPIPQVFPASGELRFPIVLRPNTSGIPSPRCRHDGFKASCEGILPPGSPPKCEWLYRPAGHGQSNQWIDTDCAGLGPAVGVYYRDAWIAQRLDAYPCSVLTAASKSLLGFLALPAPEDLTMGTAALVQPTVPFWWNGVFGNDCF